MDSPEAAESLGPETRQQFLTVRAPLEQTVPPDPVVPLGGAPAQLSVGLPTSTASPHLDERTRLWEKTKTLFERRSKMNPRKLKLDTGQAVTDLKSAKIKTPQFQI